MKRDHSESHPDLAAAADLIGIPLGRQQRDRLARFAELLSTRAVAAGLMASGDVSRVMERHVLDSLRAAPFVQGAATAADLGSGSGLPGLVLAIACVDTDFVLLDARRRAAAFVDLAIETLELPNARAEHVRLEEWSETVAVCTARALADLERSWAAASPLLAPGGRLVYFAGAHARLRHDLEGAVATEVVPSPLVDSSGPLVIIRRT